MTHNSVLSNYHIKNVYVNYFDHWCFSENNSNEEESTVSKAVESMLPNGISEDIKKQLDVSSYLIVCLVKLPLNIFFYCFTFTVKANLSTKHWKICFYIPLNLKYL